MNPVWKNLWLSAVAVAAAAVLVAASPNFVAFAQTTQPAVTSISESTVKALQEALNRQGIAVKVDGVLNEETRAAIRKYQSQHHVPVTGEPDKATLDKLGVRESATSTQAPVVAQAAPTTPPASPSMPTQPGQMPGGMMMDCPMMQGQMQSMMQMMQGMMQMMQTMQTQLQSGQPQPGQMRPGQMQPGQMQPGQMPGAR